MVLPANMFGKKDKKKRVDDRLSAIKSAKGPQLPPETATVKKPRRQARAPRKSVFRNGVLFISRSERIKCVIRDISDGGVRIAMEGTYPLPPTAVLKILQTGARKKVKLIWQDETEAGLKFTGDIVTNKNPQA